MLIFHDELISSQESHPLLTNPPYNLTLSVTELTTPKKPKEKVVSNAGAVDSEEEVTIPRPHNAFIIFRNDFAAKIKNSTSQKISIRVISQMASKQWKKENEVVKLFFKLLADMYQHRHRILYPDYKYSPRFNAEKKSKRKRSRKMRAKKEDSKDKKKGRIITWYIHDNIDKNTRSDDTIDTFRYTDLNICNPEDLNKNVEIPQKTYQPATFINYTASPTTPLMLHSTTTSSVTPQINYHHYNVNENNSFYEANSDNGSSHYGDVSSPLSYAHLEPLEMSSPCSSPPSDEYNVFLTEPSNCVEKNIPLSPFGFSLFDLADEQNFFGI
uniref:Transcription factor ste11 n=1 Tax=Anthurium amnicola TaxID=1678845 RepID=A0A1D1YFJ0_9ARAE